jgi:hypothetical protein
VRLSWSCEGTLDYIFISTSLRARELLRTPTSAEAGAENGGLPSSTVPSDHVPLAAVVEFVAKTAQSSSTIVAVKEASAGVPDATVFSTRAAAASAPLRLDPPAISTETKDSITQHATTKPMKAARHATHASRGAPQKQLSLGTTAPASGQTAPYLPKRTAHTPASAVVVYKQLMKACFQGSPADADGIGKTWAHMLERGTCVHSTCEASREQSLEHGRVLPDGRLFCHGCHAHWERRVRTELGVGAGTKCAKHTDGMCISCSYETVEVRRKLRNRLLRGHLRDLCHQLFRQLPSNTQGQAATAIFRAVRILHTELDQQILISIPARVYTSIFGWVAWHYSRQLSTPVWCVPACEHDSTEPWAAECSKLFKVIDLGRTANQVPREKPDMPRSTALCIRFPALKRLHPTLKPHSGVSSALLHSSTGLQRLHTSLGIDDLSMPAAADYTLRHHTEATCRICKCNDEDKRLDDDGREVGTLVLWNCMSCSSWWHRECLTGREALSLPEESIDDVEDGTEPPWRCEGCVGANKYAINRVLDLVRNDKGQFCLILEYLGYPYYEVSIPEEVAEVHEEHVTAYRAHLEQRTSRSLLHAVGTLIAATVNGHPLHELRMHVSMLHTDPELYLISHDSLSKRGFGLGAANIFQLTGGDDERMFIPFSKEDLLRTTTGRQLAAAPGDGGNAASGASSTTRPGDISALARHLADLVSSRSLPAALGQAVDTNTWKGLGLISGSTVTDFVATVQDFCRKYAQEQWSEMLRQELPGLTEEDITWLSTMVESMPPPAAGGGGKRQRAKESAAARERAVRRSPRHTPDVREDESDTEEDTQPIGQERDSGPSDLATKHGSLRPQLSRAFKALYGSHTRKGIIFGLQVLASFVQCLGEQFAHTSHDPVFYLRTADMKASGRWPQMPERFAYDQRQKTLTAALNFAMSQLNVERDAR